MTYVGPNGSPPVDLHTQGARLQLIHGGKMREYKGVAGGRYYLVQTLPQFESFLESALRQRTLAVDTETSGLNWVHSDVCGISVGWGVGDNYYLPIAHKTDEKQLGIFDVLPGLKKLLGNEETVKIFANAKFDLHGLRKLGIEVNGVIHDIVVLAHLLDENADHGVKELSVIYVTPDADKWEIIITDWRLKESRRRREEYSNKSKARTEDMMMDGASSHRVAKLFNIAEVHVDKKTLRKGCLRLAQEELANHLCAKNKKDDVTYDYIPLELMTPYACADVHYTWLLYKKFITLVAAHDALKKLYFNEIQLTRVLFNAEHAGAKIDVAYLKKVQPEFDEEIKRLEQEIYSAVGYEFNIGSAQQLTEALQKAGVQLKKLSKGAKQQLQSGDVSKPLKYSVDKEVLEMLGAKYPFADLILKYRTISKLKSTYIENIQELVDVQNFLHTDTNQNVTTGRMSMREPNCFDGETEVLTPDGWVRFENLSHSVAVAQWDNGKVEFVQPTGYVVKTADKLLEFKNQHINLAVTPDHRCLLRHRKTGKLRVFPASEYKSDYQQIHSGMYAGKNTFKISEHELILLCAAQADGSWTRSNNMDFGFKKKRKIVRLLSTLKALDATYTTKIDKHNRTRIYLSGYYADWLFNLIGQQKKFGSWILNFSRKRLDQFCAEVFLWDGCFTRKNNYSCNDIENVDWVQTVFALSGKRAHRRSYQGSKNINWQVDVCDRDCSSTTAIKRRVLNWNKLVYCLSVPSSYILVRRGGDICVTGQCQNIPARNKSIRRAFIVPDDGYVFVFIDYSQVELRLTADRSQDPTLLGCYPFEGKVSDVHTITLADVVLSLPLDQVQIMKTDKVGHIAKPQRGEACNCRACQYDFYRNIAKRVNFGIIYGAGPEAIQRQVSTPTRFVDRDECEEYIKRYFEKYPGVKDWIMQTQAFMKRNGFVQNTFGRYRRLRIDKSMAKWQVERLCRQGVNFCIQGEAADLFKVAAVRVDNIFRKAKAKTRLVNFVHDELQFYWHKKEMYLLPEVKKAMEDFHYTVPIIAEISYSKTDWGSKEALK